MGLSVSEDQVKDETFHPLISISSPACLISFVMQNMTEHDFPL